MDGAIHTSNPVWSIVAPPLALVFLAALFLGPLPHDAVATLFIAAALLGVTVFAAVHHAEILALSLGEPFGSILLAIAVTVIEVALIISIMFAGGAGAEAVARDTVFAAVMIVLNGVVGLCLICGGHRHHEQSFQLRGVSAALGVLGILAVLALIMPNFVASALGPFYSRAQLLTTGVLSLALWAVFVFVQTIRHRDYFLDAPSASDLDDPEAHQPHARRPARPVALASFALLILALVAVVLLSKLLSKPLDHAVRAAELPQAVVGAVIALVVLLPESLAAVRSALRDRLQNSLNLALGSAIASIGLTIPSVAIVSVIIGMPVALGVDPANMILLSLTLFVSTLTLGTGRTTVLQGASHLAIFVVFLLIAAVP